MAIGIGGSSAEIELEKLSDMTGDVTPIDLSEYQDRIAKAQRLMRETGVMATYLNAGTNLNYFTGTPWNGSERMVGALLLPDGDPIYIAPYFERDTFAQKSLVPGEIVTWQEHESPYVLALNTLKNHGVTSGNLAIDEATPFFISNGLDLLSDDLQLVSATAITAGCRRIKSEAEIALLKQAKAMTLEVHKAAARILRPGITAQEVTNFIDQAHRKVGATRGSYFCIVLFGEDSSFPHGVKTPKPLEDGEVVLIDTGCQLEGYNSDITRSYVYGPISQRHRDMWAIEKAAQQAAFDAAQVGAACASVDQAARDYLERHGLGPDYQTPGLPHRTGHGVGLDIHEWPYLVRGNETPLEPGMCFSNEPMLVLPGEFGIRLEDHFYMTEDGPEWFTTPSPSIDNPFGNEP
ncbi:M24 family metallopeptidase [Rhodovibrionaceae bacterium A322]